MSTVQTGAGPLHAAMRERAWRRREERNRAAHERQMAEMAELRASYARDRRSAARLARLAPWIWAATWLCAGAGIGVVAVCWYQLMQVGQ